MNGISSRKREAITFLHGLSKKFVQPPTRAELFKSEMSRAAVLEFY